jgi:hypothetical protein
MAPGCPAAPAPGFRDSGNNKGYGTWYSVGNYGFSWSSFASGSGAPFLHFTSAGLSPQSGGNRGHGLPLRCLQE